MKEKIIGKKGSGAIMLLLYFALTVLSVMALIWALPENEDGVFNSIPVFILSVLWLSIGWVVLLGLKIIKPSEALVLTLFGRYVGTLKNDGFYWVNPFCVGVNPAAATKLNQSRDVAPASSQVLSAAGASG